MFQHEISNETSTTVRIVFEGNGPIGKESIMIFTGNIALSFVAWIAERLGFALELPGDLLVDALDERMVSEQLAYGRD